MTEVGSGSINNTIVSLSGKHRLFILVVIPKNSIESANKSVADVMYFTLFNTLARNAIAGSGHGGSNPI